MLKQEELDSIRAFCCLCELEVDVTINGVTLDYNDFGVKKDIRPDDAEPYGCGYMQFIPNACVPLEVLHKYNITDEEAEKIQEKLDCLTFGGCGWCT